MEFTFTFTVGDDNTPAPTPTTASTCAGNSEIITMSSLPQLQLVTRYALLCFYLYLSYTTMIPMVYVDVDVANPDARYGDLYHFTY